MSTAAIDIRYLSGGSSTDSGGCFVFPYQLLFDRIFAVVLDSDRYQEGDATPTVKATIRATEMLGDTLEPDHLQNIEIDVYLGEINITWRNMRRGRRVKVIFANDAKAFSLYHEQSRQGRVEIHRMTPNASADTLRQKVQWLYE